MCGGQVDDNHKERQSMGEADAKWMDQRKGGLTAAGGEDPGIFWLITSLVPPKEISFQNM